MNCEYCGNPTNQQDMFNVWDLCRCFCDTCGKMLEDEDAEDGLHLLEAALCFECQLIESGG